MASNGNGHAHSNHNATNGHATNGHATNGHATNGHSTNGHSTNGHATNGHANGHAALNTSNGKSHCISESEWEVHKFGGTSLADASCYENVVTIIDTLDVMKQQRNDSNDGPHDGSRPRSHASRLALVVSAMGDLKNGGQKVDKVTSQLIKCTQLAASRDTHYLSILAHLKQRHTDVINNLIKCPDSSASPAAPNNPALEEYALHLRTTLINSLNHDFDDFSYILRACWLSKEFNASAHNWWFGYGELWSARLIANYINFRHALFNSNNNNNNNMKSLNNSGIAVCLDAREVLVLAPGKDPLPDYNKSRSLLNKWLESTDLIKQAKIVVITGYIATSAEGFPTTLGRDGSDYSASIFAALLSARNTTIWTDVDGIYSANPAEVTDAVLVNQMTYAEASELAYFGAKVLHPRTMTPVVVAGIPIWIKNTFKPQVAGSCILSDLHTQHSKHTLKGVSHISNLTLITVEGTGMIGVPGVANRIFGAVCAVNTSIVLITQGGSEHSICFAVPMAQGPQSIAAVRREFRDSLENGELQKVDMSDSCACIALVGDGMKSSIGLAGKMFSALAKAGINIRAIAQGASERNISVIVGEAEAHKGLRAIHQAFFSSNKNLPCWLTKMALRETCKVLHSKGDQILTIQACLPSPLNLAFLQPHHNINEWQKFSSSSQLLASYMNYIASECLVEIKSNNIQNFLMSDDDQFSVTCKISELKASAKAQDKSARFIGRLDVDAGSLTIGPELYSNSHPFSLLNSHMLHACVVITTKQLGPDCPLIYQTPAFTL